MYGKDLKTHAPFGVATRRFTKIGFHPELDKTGAMKREITKTGPGSYYPQYPKCKKKGVSWKLQLDSEEYSKYLNYKFPEVLRKRRLQKTLGGPGTNDVNEDIFRQFRSSVLENVGFGAGKRFQVKEKRDSVPPPETYFRNILKHSTMTIKYFSDIPTFEWDGFIDRFKSSEPRYGLPPNRYDVKDHGGIDATLNRVVSLRGPYELFTGPRDGSTIKNHFTPTRTKTPDYYYIKPSDRDVLLHHPSKARTGKFLKAKRFTLKPSIRSMLVDISLCYKDPNDPGPAHYDLSKLASIRFTKPSLHPFNTSNLNARPPTNWTIFPGPGRYSPKSTKCQRSKKPSYVFLSKAPRQFFTIIDYRNF